MAHGNSGGTLYGDTNIAGSGTGVFNASIGTFNSILKEFYIGPVQDQLNQEVFVVEMFEKATVDWNGKYCIIPVHTGRNTGVSFVADGDALATAGNQTFNSLQVRAKFLYGSFQVTGPAISAAAKGSTNSFISYVDAEMTKLVEDVRDQANIASVTGGRVKGFLSERQILAATGAGPSVATGGSTTVSATAVTLMSPSTAVVYDGDFAPFAATGAAVATWVRVRLFRMDTYAEILTTGPNTNIFVVAADEAAGTLNIQVGDNNAGATNLTTAAVTAPFATAVVLHDTRAVDSAGTLVIGTVPTGASGDFELSTETTGIFGNLGDPTHFSTDRTTATGTTALQSRVVTMDTDATVTRLDLTLTRIQTVFDNVLRTSGKEPNQILMNALQRQKYMALLGQFINSQADKATKGDGGFLGLSYGGVPIETSRAISNGCMAFLSTDSWKLAELESPGFADLDGNVLSRTGNSDAYQGYYRWYWNVVCTQPNSNAILCGLTLS